MMAHKSSAGLAARHEAVRLLDAVLDNRQPLSEALTQAGPKLDMRDKAFARAIVATSLRRKGQIDDVISHFLKRPLPAKAKTASHILLSAGAQLLFLEVPPHAVIDMAVQLAKQDQKTAGFKNLINAVLRRVSEKGGPMLAKQDAAQLNIPDWLWQRWQANYGEECARAIADAHLLEPPLDITVKNNPDDWAKRLGGEITANGSIRISNAGAVNRLVGFDDGEWWVQDMAASLPALLLGDQHDKLVFDLCAAPGGKTAQLAQAQAKVIALDHSKPRLERLGENLARLKLTAQLEQKDIFDFKPEIKADAILLDAPCSATGTIRRHPDIPHLKSSKTITELAKLQARFLHHAISLLKPGGILIYSTCSLEPEEGEQQIAKAINDLSIERVPIEAEEIGGLDHLITEMGDLRSLPFHEARKQPQLLGMDGFFVSRLRLKK